jgi:halogenation protein CepH
VGFYNLHEDSYFWEAHKIANTAPTDLESFINLVGGVAGDEFGSGQFAASSEQLAEAFGGETPHAHACGGFLGKLLAAGAELQVSAALGDHAAVDAAAGDSGLTVAPDGLSWVRS